MTGISASLALRRALIIHLRADEALMDRLNGIYDAPGRDRLLPWLDIGGVRTESWSSKSATGMRHFPTFRLFAARPDELDLLDLADALVHRLDGASLDLEGHALVMLRFQSLVTLVDPDDIRQARIAFEALTHPL